MINMNRSIEYAARFVSTIFLLALLSGCFEFAGTTVGDYCIAEMSLPVEMVWEFEADEELFTPATIHGDSTIYFRSVNNVYAVSPTSGKIQWQRQLATSESLLPITHDRYVYLVNRSGDEIEAIDKVTGETVWTLDPSQYTRPRSGKSLVRFWEVDDQILYVVVNLLRGTDVLMLDPQSGNVLGKAPLELSIELAAPRAFYVGSSWVVVETNISWVLTKDLKRVIFKYPDVVLSHQPPTFANETLYTSGESVEAILLPNYHTMWQYKDECRSLWDQVPDSPTVVADGVYPLTTCGDLYKLNAQDGRIVWKLHTPTDKDMRSFAVLGSTGYVASTNTTIRAIDLNEGSEIGRLRMIPPVVSKYGWNYLATSADIMILTYGNKQAFAFQAK
jgi:outer membrane protein assembly factor BamB